MTTEAVKQDKNKQIAETEKQPVCSGTDKTQRELTLHILAPLPCLAGGLSPPAHPTALEPSAVLQELAAATRWLACPLWERVQGDIPAPAPAPPPATLLTPSMSQTWPLQDPMQSTMQTIYFLFFFFFLKVTFPPTVVSWISQRRGQGGARGGEAVGVHDQQESREQKLPFCGNQAGSALPPKQSLPGSVAIGWSTESRMTCYFGTLPREHSSSKWPATSTRVIPVAPLLECKQLVAHRHAHVPNCRCLLPQVGGLGCPKHPWGQQIGHGI